MAKNKNAGHKGSYGYQKLKEREPRACIRFKCALPNTILDILRRRPGWVEVKEEGEWDFYWCDVSWLRENFDHTYMDEHVRICHFRNHYELTRKNYIVKNLKRFRKQIEREAGKLEATKCDFFPKTFEMPSEYHLFVEEFRKNPGITWIMKPVARSQGRGIFLFRKLKDVIDWRKDGVRTDDQKDETQVENYVAQCYIENPYLIGGRKFDLRVYVLVMSYIPLKAWLYRDGFARFSNTRFTLSSIDDHYVHLTNVAVQKTAPDYDPEKGCKWMIQRFRQYLTAKHGAEVVETLFAEMDNIFIKSLQSVQKVIISDKHCFELYGYDILIDQDLKPEFDAGATLTAVETVTLSSDTRGGSSKTGPAGVWTFSFSADRDTRTNLKGKVQREQCISAVKSTQQLLRVSDVTRKQCPGLWIYAQHRSGGPNEQQQALFASSSASCVGDLTLVCTRGWE
ncbi:putative tubulin polyglutamylase TTLL9 [Platysternon megacephalum]|uniref:Tubulin--tyrosine ligase-like protein 9 n=1 Tax=Platysternon megacephalum TaxID=55544 RepID=A0A4D9E207_9SAUR|nr:putative tubulin polyglutamylase TTLL9 [Platysternon megacephalum]